MELIIMSKITKHLIVTHIEKRFPVEYQIRCGTYMHFRPKDKEAEGKCEAKEIEIFIRNYFGVCCRVMLYKYSHKTINNIKNWFEPEG
jgi:hypothetical protein